METKQIHAAYFCGVDLHSTFLFATVVDKDGNIYLKRKLNNEFDLFYRSVQPFLPDLAVGTESTYNWYWLADGCKKQNIPFYLGHAHYMKLISGAKKKTDKLDSQTQANLMRTGFFPLAYAYPKEMRTVRDLLRRRMYYVALRAAANTHIQTIFAQQAIFSINGQHIKTKHTRKKLPELVSNQNNKLSIETDLNVMEALDKTIRILETHILKIAQTHDPETLSLLKTVTGIGDILSLTILYEVHTIDRFASVKQFSSYCRVVKCERSSAGKKSGGGNQKIGNPYLKWTFDQIINTGKKKSPEIKKKFDRLVAKHGSRKARAIMGHKYAIAVYYMLKNKKPFNEELFLR